MTRVTAGRPIATAIAASCLCLVGGSVNAQQGAADLAPRLLRQADVAAAVALADTLEPWVLERQVALCEVPAPPFKEQARGEA